MRNRSWPGRLPPPRPRVVFVTASLLLAILVGIVFRLYRLDEQLLLGDELHSVRAVVSFDLPEILTSYRSADHCIPLSALFELRTASGAPLEDGFMRLPGVLSGIVFLLAVPPLLGRLLGWNVALISAWLFALSPGLVLYSRIARPYMPATLLATLSLLSFYAWWRSSHHRWAVIYIAGAALTFWFSPVMTPYLGAPLLFALLHKAFVRNRGPDLGAVAVFAGGLALALAAVLAPAWESFFDLVRAKAGDQRPGWASLEGLLELHAGSGHGWVAVAVWGMGVGGLMALASRRADLAWLTATALSVQGVGLWIASPFGLSSPMIWNRYFLPAVPLLLLWVAVGLEAAVSWIPAPRVKLRLVVVALFLGSWFVAGPFNDPRIRWSSFLHGVSFLGFHGSSEDASAWSDLPVYRQIENAGGGVVEVPGLPTWRPHHHLAAYQDQHRQPVLVAPQEPRLFGREIELRHYVEPRPAAILATPARWVVVHRDPALDLSSIGWPPPPAQARFLDRRAHRIAGRFESAWGPPDLTGHGLWVWDLHRLRRLSEARAEHALKGRMPLRTAQDVYPKPQFASVPAPPGVP